MANKTRKKVLVVDSDADMAAMINRCLKEEGFEIDHTFNGHNAFEKTQESDYDLILADIDINYTEGISLYSKIKKASPETFDKMIFTTNKLNAELKNFSDFTERPIIEKPFTVSSFMSTLSGKLLKDFMKD
ncbi:MAG: response regulator [Deltaproteobacteria bacterium]|nr:response regulator [Deltaproteobacteria bacterium]